MSELVSMDNPNSKRLSLSHIDRLYLNNLILQFEIPVNIEFKLFAKLNEMDSFLIIHNIELIENKLYLVPSNRLMHPVVCNNSSDTTADHIPFTCEGNKYYWQLHENLVSFLRRVNQSILIPANISYHEHYALK